MAHYEKFHMTDVVGLLAHDNRKMKKPTENIDSSRSHLNYNLCPHENGEYDFFKNRVEYVKENGGTVRDNSVVMCSLIVTLPENFPNNEELEKQFFKAAYEMAKEKHGEENIISAWVHYDEAKKKDGNTPKPHIHIKFTPVLKTKKKYKNGTEKDRLAFNANKILTKEYLQKFHKELDEYIEDYIGFKTDVHTGITKKQGGHKTIAELKAMPPEEKDILNEYWQEYKEVSKKYWQEYKAKKQQIKDQLWELKKGIWGNEKQLKRDLDFIDNLNKKGFILALFRLITALFVSTRKNTLKDKQRELEGKLSELEKARQSISNYQHNAKEYLKKKDFERIEIALDKWETAVLNANKEIRDLFRKSEIEQNRGISERNKDIEEINCL